MTEEQVKQIVIDIIEEIAPDEDTSDIDHEVALRDQLGAAVVHPRGSR